MDEIFNVLEDLNIGGRKCILAKVILLECIELKLNFLIDSPENVSASFHETLPIEKKKEYKKYLICVS